MKENIFRAGFRGCGITSERDAQHVNFSSAETSARARRLAAVTAAGMAVLALSATLFGQERGPVIPPILPMLVGSVIVSEVISAYVLFSEFNRSRLAWLLYIAAAYVLTAVLTVPYILTFPEVFAPGGLFGATPQTALHMWVLWHLTFPSLLIAAVISGWLPHEFRIEPRERIPWLIASVIVSCIAVGVAAPILSETWGTRVPDLIHGRVFTAATTKIVLPAILVLDVSALGLLYHRARTESAIAIWLFIAVAASALDAVMGVLGSRYSYGWYIGKIFLVVSSSVMLMGFIAEAARLRTRLGRTIEELRLTRERERYLAQERAHRLARFDELTGLANRAHLEERLSELAALPSPPPAFTVIFVSIDRFKEINDQFGHAFADLVLTEVAERLRAAVRRDDTVARFSGDEFVILAPSLPSLAAAEALAEALRAALREPYTLPHGIAHVTASIGIAMFPDDGTSAETALDDADAAARRSKSQGGDRTSFYSRAFVEEARARHRVREELRIALLQNQFALYYQPIVHLRTGETTKVEALIRWVHPERGTIPPGDFIPVAETTGLMQRVGYWVIEEAVRQAKVWDTSGVPKRIAVNVSARQLEDRAFIVHLSRTLTEAGLPARMLEFEITESAAMIDMSLAQAVLDECRSLGVSISLDDFGTYYSSLTYLKRLPIDNVKIDRSFVQNLPFVESDKAIVAGILGLARALKRTAVAEGIETEAQRAWLVTAGCDFGQGYHFARPMPAAEFADWDLRRREVAATTNFGGR